MFNLVKEALGKPVLDSVCSQTVAREIWFNVFFDTLNDKDIENCRNATEF